MSQSGEVMVQVQNLVKQYGDHYAVDHLSFQVKKGQVLGFLGPNGAGKSTTMNMITGYISASEGSVMVAGHDILDEPEEAKKHLGYLPEIPPLYLDMTVEEYLFFVAEIKGVPKEERSRQVQEVMEQTKITSYAHRLTKYLSKGYRQRTGIAGAMIGNPEVIILDEPTVGLDPTQIIEVRDLIRRLSANHTVILSSHIMQEISAVCNMVLIIDKGKMVVMDSPENLSRHLTSTSTVILEVKGTKEEITEVLKDVPGISNMQMEEPKEDGIRTVHLYAEKEKDIREEVFRAFARKDKVIYGMHLQEVTLEDVFLTVTKEAEEKSKRQQDEAEADRKEEE